MLPKNATIIRCRGVQRTTLLRREETTRLDRTYSMGAPFAESDVKWKTEKKRRQVQVSCHMMYVYMIHRKRQDMIQTASVVFW